MLQYAQRFRIPQTWFSIYLEVSDGEFAAVGFDGGQQDLVVFVTLVASKQRLWSSVVCI